MIKQIEPNISGPFPQWQTIYCSLMLLLVVFFVMLITYSSIDKDKLSQISTSITQPTKNMDQAIQSMKQLAINLEMNNDYALIKTHDGFKAVFPNPVLFGSGDASLNKKVYPVLDGIIEIAKRHHLSIQVEGHTDNQPIWTAKFPSNWELSAMRAVNILRYLQNRGDLSAKRLLAVGFGEHQPAASNDTPEGRQKNRRIVIRFRSEI